MISTPLRLAMLLVWLVCMMSLGESGINRWAHDGPKAGAATTIVFRPGDETMMYAATNDGLFYSTDGGESWVAKIDNLTHQRVQDLLLDPVNPDVMHVATNTGLYKSTDGGDTWSLRRTLQDNIYCTLSISPLDGSLYCTGWNASLRSTDGGDTWSSYRMNDQDSVYYLSIDPTTPTNLYAVSHSNFLHRSTDNGTTWTRIVSSMGDTRFLGVVVDPADSRNVYAAAMEYPPYAETPQLRGGVYKSTDGGSSWTLRNAGLTASDVKSITVSDTFPAFVFAVTDGSGICRSSDGGLHWLPINSGLESTVLGHVHIDPNRPDNLFLGTAAGVYHSTDSGDHWHAISPGLADCQLTALDVISGDPPRSYAGSGGGVVFLREGASPWISLSRPFPGGCPYNVSVSPVNPEIHFVELAYDQVYRSTDGGNTWAGINSNLLRRRITLIEPDPVEAGVVYLGNSQGLFKSTDWGENWAMLNPTMGNKTVYTLWINPQDHLSMITSYMYGVISKTTDGGQTWTSHENSEFWYVYLIRSNQLNPNGMYATDGWFVYVSHDGGDTWMPTPWSNEDYSRKISALVLDPNDFNHLYAGTNQGVHRTTDGGFTWSECNNGLGDPGINDLLMDPADSRLQYAATWHGLYRTTDGGDGWVRIEGDLESQSMWELRWDPARPATMYTTIWGGIGRSTDGGAHWTLSRNGFPSTGVTAVLADVGPESALLVGTGNGGVYRSTDDGQTWCTANTGLYFVTIHSFARGVTDPEEVVATTDYGVVHSTDSGKTWSLVTIGFYDPSSPYNEVNTTDIYSWIFDPAEPTIQYVTTDTGLYKSDDGGLSYYLIRSVGSGFNSMQLCYLAMDPSDPSTLYLSSPGSSGIFKSIDRGTSWGKLGSSRGAGPILVLPEKSNIIFASTSFDLQRSFDSGLSWQILSSGLTTRDYFALLALDPDDPTVLYASTYYDFYRIQLGTGDLNSDGAIDSLDAMLLAVFLSGDLSGIREMEQIGDLSVDGVLNARDLVLLNNIIAGNIIL